MMRPWISKNAGLRPEDPEYDHEYDEEDDYDAYVTACEEREESRRDDR